MLSTTSRAASRVLATRSSLAGSVIATQTRSYHENIVEHYENPRNVGSLDKNDDNVGTVRSCILFIWKGSMFTTVFWLYAVKQYL